MATYGGKSPEFVQRKVAAGRRRCWSYGSCEVKRKVSVGAQGLADLDSMNERQRGARNSPEFAGAVVGTAAASCELWAAWWREGEIVWGEMVARMWGFYSQRLDKKRLLHQCQLSSRNQCSNGQRRRSCAESGEDEADVERARSSAK